MHTPTIIHATRQPVQLADADFENAIIKGKSSYKEQLKKWQKHLTHIQQAYYHQNKRALILFEGWDASGKGGAIRRLTERLDPRGFDVIPIAAPTEDEISRHYLYRFFKQIPKAGCMTILDRSYYGRVLVERIEGFAKTKEWQRGYQEINEFERLLHDDGVCIVKIFLHITPEEQLNRFRERLHNPYKRWKMTQEDLRNREKWPQYETAINDMFKHTATNIATWNLIAANMKWYARVETLKLVCKALEKDVEIIPKALDAELIASAERQLGIQIER